MAMFSFAWRGLARASMPCVSDSVDTVLPPADAWRGPGWYDSSWDLRRGLIVREGLPADAKLHEWLEHHARERAAVS